MILELHSIQKHVVNVICDERCWQPPEILLQCRRNGVDVQIWVRDVVVGVVLEA